MIANRKKVVKLFPITHSSQSGSQVERGECRQRFLRGNWFGFGWRRRRGFRTTIFFFLGGGGAGGKA